MDDEQDLGGAARPTRRERRDRRLLAGVGIGIAIGSLLSGVGAVWAGHQFSDVPDTNPFHADIDWMVDNGIADGYADGTFKPTNPVSRQAFAAFLHRYNGEFERVLATVDHPTGTVFVVDVDCPTGKQPIAGGGLNFDETIVMQSSSQLIGGTWQVRYVSRSGSAVNPGPITAMATCIPS